MLRIPAQKLINAFKGTEEECRCFKNATDSEQFSKAESFRDQIGIIGRQFESQFGEVPYLKIGNVFNKSRQSVRNQFLKSQHITLNVGRPPVLSDGEISLVVQFIKQLHTCSGYSLYLSMSEISDYISMSFGKFINTDTLRHIFRTRLTDEFKTCIGIPLDQDRFCATLDDIENNLTELSDTIDGVPSNFVFNVDEVGHSEYADSFEKYVIVPASYSGKTAPYPVKKNGKHASCIACISPTGMACKPLFTVPRLTVDPQLYDKLPFDSFEIVHTDSGYVNTAVFHFWLTDIFFPYLRKLRDETGYKGKAVLIMDGFLGHVNAIDQVNCEDEDLIIHYLVPHTSDMLQPLDVGIFGAMKRFMSNCKSDNSATQQTNQIFKIHKSLFQAACPSNCKAAFAATGIVTKLVKKEDVYSEIVSFDFLKCKKVRYFDFSFMDNIVRSGYRLSQIQRYIYLKTIYPEVDPIPRMPIQNFQPDK